MAKRGHPTSPDSSSGPEATFWEGADVSARTRFTEFKKLGKGAYGSVVRLLDTATGEYCAVKRVEPVFRNRTWARRVLREIRLLRGFTHPNVVRLHCLLPPEDPRIFNAVWMVLDYMDRGDLYTSVIRPRVSLPRGTLRSYMGQMFAGLAHVHSVHGIHRDMKPENVLVDSRGTPSSGATTMRTFCSHHAYLTLHAHVFHAHLPFTGHVKLCDFNLSRSTVGVAGHPLHQDTGGSDDEEGEIRAPRTVTSHTANALCRICASWGMSLQARSARRRWWRGG